MTALAEAFAKNGVKPEDAAFDIAIAKYLNSGGTIARACDRLNAAAARMSGMSQKTDAASGRTIFAQTRQQVEGGGAIIAPPNGPFLGAPSPSFNRGGGGHQADASRTGRLVCATPVREPTQAQRAATLSAAKVASISVMDTLKIDGRAIGDWTVAEARRRGHDKSREGYILLAAARVVANAEPNALLRNVVKVRELQRIQQRATEVADAV